MSPSMPTQADAEPAGDLGVGIVKVPVTAVKVPYDNGQCKHLFVILRHITNSGVGSPDGTSPVRAVLYATVGNVRVRRRANSLQGFGFATSNAGLDTSGRRCENSGGEQSANEQRREDHVEDDAKTQVTL